MRIMDSAASVLAYAQRQLDRAISSETRSRVYDRVQVFANERPLLFTFLVSQLLTSLLPIALFLAFTTSILVLSVGAALLFSLFWLGVALLFLIPTLFVTVSLGLLVFVWALAARFAWNALPSGFKSAIMSTPPMSSSPPKQLKTTQQQRERNGNNDDRRLVATRSDSSSSADTSSPLPTISAHQAETNGTEKKNGGGVGVADLTKFKEEKEGNVTS